MSRCLFDQDGAKFVGLPWALELSCCTILRVASHEEHARIGSTVDANTRYTKHIPSATCEIMFRLTCRKRRTSCKDLSSRRLPGRTAFMVLCKTKERKAKRAAELKKSKAKKEEVAAELARLDQDSKEEEKRVEVKLF